MRLQILFLAILFAVICEYHCQQTIQSELNTTLWNWDTNYELNETSHKYNPYNNDGYNNDGYDNDDYETSDYRTSRTRKSPDEYGNMNLYFREPSRDGKRKRPKRLRFPVHRFERTRFPPFPPLLSFLPYLPIFADRFTKQTIIYSPTGGVYIIPPVINFYGELFSIAELIASGYVSLVSSGAPPPPAVDVAPLVQPGAVVGPGVPGLNPATGGFKGGVRTEYRSFPRPKYAKIIEEEVSDYVVEGRSRSRASYGYGY